MMNVSPASEDDLPALCELLGILFAQEAEFRPDAERPSAGLRSILGRPEVGQVLVLRDGLTVVGMVAVLFLPSTALGGRVAILENMVVRPNARGRGTVTQTRHTIHPGDIKACSWRSIAMAMWPPSSRQNCSTACSSGRESSQTIRLAPAH